jgi:hypothetical protein
MPCDRMQARRRDDVGAGYEAGIKIPVCERHYRKNLWWYKGTIFCRGEEEAE